MIQITLQELITSFPALKALADKEVPAKVAFLVAGIINKISEEYKTFENTRESLIRKYGEKDQNGEVKVQDDGTVLITPQWLDSFNHDLQELLETKVTIVNELIPLSALEALNFTANDMRLLMSFINGEK